MCSFQQEVEELKQDLEVCKQRLDAKYNAISILKKQVCWELPPHPIVPQQNTPRLKRAPFYWDSTKQHAHFGVGFFFRQQTIIVLSKLWQNWNHSAFSWFKPMQPTDFSLIYSIYSHQTPVCVCVYIYIFKLTWFWSWYFFYLQAEENNHEHVTNELRAKETSLKLAEVCSILLLVLLWWMAAS